MIPLAPGFFDYRGSLELDGNYVVFSAFMGNSSIGLQTIEGYNYKDDTVGGWWKDAYDNSNTFDLMLYRYTDQNGAETTNSSPFVSNHFDLAETYKLTAFKRSGSFDTAQADIEFLNASNGVVCAIRITSTVGTFNEVLQYGTSLSSLSTAPTTGSGSGTVVWGYLTFDATNIYYADAGQMGTTSRIDAWSLACDMASVRKIRVSNVSASSATSGSSWAGIRMGTVN